MGSQRVGHDWVTSLFTMLIYFTRFTQTNKQTKIAPYIFHFFLGLKYLTLRKYQLVWLFIFQATCLPIVTHYFYFSSSFLNFFFCSLLWCRRQMGHWMHFLTENWIFFKWSNTSVLEMWPSMPPRMMYVIRNRKRGRGVRKMRRKKSDDTTPLLSKYLIKIMQW